MVSFHEWMRNSRPPLILDVELNRIALALNRSLRLRGGASCED